MYCKNCGKQIANDAFMCPTCGSPTGTSLPMRKVYATQVNPGSAIPFVAMILSIISIAYAPFVCTAFFLSWNAITVVIAAIVLVLFTLSGLILGLYSIYNVRRQPMRTKIYSVISVVFTSVVFLLLLVMLLVFLFLY